MTHSYLGTLFAKSLNSVMNTLNRRHDYCRYNKNVNFTTRIEHANNKARYSINRAMTPCAYGMTIANAMGTLLACKAWHGN